MIWVRRISILSIAMLCLAVVVTAQDKASSSSFQSQEVKFEGHEVQLAGTLAMPKLDAGKRAPGVLIVAGSGATPRDGVMVGEVKQPIYRDLAEHLAGRGLAVLRYDKRCAGASDCKAATTFDDYVDDARKAMLFLKNHPQVDPAKVFLFGHSEGGYIVASIASHEEAKFAGVILAATPGRTMGKLMREQFQLRMAEAGKPQADIQVFLAKYDRIIKGVMVGRSDYSDENLNAKDPFDALLLNLIKQRGIIVSLLINDPLQIVNGVEAPILILQGKKDTQIGVKDAQYLEEALKRASHPDATMQLFDDVDHLLKTSKGPVTAASYADASRPLDAGLLNVLTEWMLKRTK